MRTTTEGPVIDPFSDIDGTEANTNQVRLSTGEVLIAIKAKGYHIQKAQQLSGGKAEQYAPACMSVMFTTSEGAHLPMEYYPQLPAPDYSALFSKLIELGFIGV